MPGTLDGNADTSDIRVPGEYVTNRRQSKSFNILFRMPFIGVLLLIVAACRDDGVREQDSLKPISNGLLYPLVPEDHKFVRHHLIDYSTPIAHVPVSRHPLLPSSLIHVKRQLTRNLCLSPGV